MKAKYGSTLVLGILLINVLSGQHMAESLRLASDNPKVPTLKVFEDDWIVSLYDRGEPIIYTKENSNNFEFIGMPIGGIGAGQLYLGGDGTLWFWDIFNTNKRFGDVKGVAAYQYPYMRKEEGQFGTKKIEQGFAVRITNSVARTTKALDRSDIDHIAFLGQYPIGNVKYQDEELPVTIEMEAFSPFVPLDVDKSSFPATIFRFKVKNTSTTEAEIEFSGWLENAACIESRNEGGGSLKNVINTTSKGHLQLDMAAIPDQGSEGEFKNRHDFGSMALTLLNPGKDARGTPQIGERRKSPLTPLGAFNKRKSEEMQLGFGEGKLVGSLIEKLTLGPGEEKQVEFLLSWYFPNSQVALKEEKNGKSYNNRFGNAAEVAKGVCSDFDNLVSQTKTWRDTWYNSTLPYWFLDRTFLNTSILASSTSHIFDNGQFYGFEGGYQGRGTCTHVWGYVQAMGRLFPDLEKSLREKVDFLPISKGGAQDTSGMIMFRANATNKRMSKSGYAVDGQAGIILRTFLAHQMSADDSFLKRNYKRIKMAMQGLTKTNDADHDGILTGAQHNTLDADWYGKITWLSLHYTAALRAMAVMADEMGDTKYARFCRRIADKGKKYIEEKLFNGEYFFHETDPENPQSPGIYSGCEYSQLLGQSWAYQVGLGEILDPEKTATALESLWKYNFSTDVGPFRETKKRGRWYAMPGEGGLIACTWPRGGSDALDKGNQHFAAYNNECQNGYEYAATSTMMWHNMPERAMAHIWYMHNNRYIGSKRNPWCEVEWGIHYSRSMASYGHFTGVSGFKYQGPKGILGFDPKIQQNDFKSAFVGAEGWGTYSQKKSGQSVAYTLEIKHGKLNLNQLELPLIGIAKMKALNIELDGETIRAKRKTDANKLILKFPKAIHLNKANTLRIKI